jgi:hypothetical protein
VIAKCKLAGTAATVRVESNLEVETATRIMETWTAVDIAGPAQQRFELPAQLQYKRRLFITYLDADWAVLRDEGNGVSILKRNKEANEEANASGVDSAVAAAPAAPAPVVNGGDVEVLDSTA